MMLLIFIFDAGFNGCRKMWLNRRFVKRTLCVMLFAILCVIEPENYRHNVNRNRKREGNRAIENIPLQKFLIFQIDYEKVNSPAVRYVKCFAFNYSKQINEWKF